MILKIDGDIKPYYAQTLCMMFFPGVKFPEGEEETPDTPAASFAVRETPCGAHADVTLKIGADRADGAGDCCVEDGIDPARARQIAAGTAFYRAASALTGVRPPWGIMTGVRPAKLASERFRAGDSVEEAARWIERKYLAAPRKASLAAAVADAERRLIRPELARRCSVYVAIPFCPSRCAYCSFVSYTSGKLLSLIPSYLEALRTNIRSVFAVIRSLGIPVSTVYIGGGTPTVLDAAQLRFLLETIAAETDVTALAEFTLEAGRPDTITAEKLAVAREYGVTRISVNTQTLNEEILAAIGRRHTAAQFFEAFETARESGIPQINVDLIAGLPGESADSFASSLDRILPLGAENVTVHTFCVKKSADIRWEEKPVYDRVGLEAAAAVDTAQKMLLGGGYIPYYMYRQKNTVGNLENVGYARAGREGLYNVYMMEEVHSIFAAGASAVTKFVSPMKENGDQRIDRIFEAKYPYEYLKDYAPDNLDARTRAFADFAAAFYKTYC